MGIKNLSKKQSQSLYTIAAIIVVAIICTAILQFYKYSNNEKMHEASTTYQKALIASEDPKSSLNTKVSKFENVTNNYPTTSFGIFASWQLADLYITPTKLDTKNFTMNIGNIPKAISVLKQSIKENPSDSLTNITKTRLAKLYIAANQPDKAIKMLHSINFLEKNAYPLALLGQAYSQKDDKTKAIKTWQKALQDPNISAQFKQIVTQFINNSK